MVHNAQFNYVLVNGHFVCVSPSHAVSDTVLSLCENVEPHLPAYFGHLRHPDGNDEPRPLIQCGTMTMAGGAKEVDYMVFNDFFSTRPGSKGEKHSVKVTYNLGEALIEVARVFREKLSISI